MGRYKGDPLGPTFEDMLRDGRSLDEIILKKR